MPATKESASPDFPARKKQHTLLDPFTCESGAHAIFQATDPNGADVPVEINAAKGTRKACKKILVETDGPAVLLDYGESKVSIGRSWLKVPAALNEHVEMLHEKYHDFILNYPAYRITDAEEALRGPWLFYDRVVVDGMKPRLNHNARDIEKFELNGTEFDMLD